MKPKILLFTFLTIINFSLLAQSGSLDTTFGIGGKVITEFVASVYDYGRSVAIQSDGKIVFAGYSGGSGNYKFALVRYNTNGSLDSGFGTNGKILTDFGNSSIINSLAIQNDGKIVVAGASSYYFALARYNNDGTLDTTFSSDGKVITSFGSSSAEGRAVSIQNDGKIVVAGYYQVGFSSNFALARYNTNGSLDNTFGSNGKVMTAVGNSDDNVSTIGIQTDGKILVGGDTYDGSYPDFFLVRYNTNGSLDTSFGSNGKVFTDIGDDRGKALVIQADNKILMTGYSFIGSGSEIVLMRYNENGSLDNGFGMNGIVTKAIGQYPNCNSIVLQTDDKIILGGVASKSSNSDFTLVRYNTDGGLDSTFGSDGLVLTDFSNSNEGITSLSIQADGKIIAVGGSNNTSDSITHFAVARYYNDISNPIKTITKKNTEIKISPNPFSHSTTIHIDNLQSSISNLQFTLYNLLGQPVHRQQILNPKSEILNLNLPGGIYFYKVISDQQPVANGKLVIQ